MRVDKYSGGIASSAPLLDIPAPFCIIDNHHYRRGAMRTFTSIDIEKITGLKSNTLHYYIQRGILTPDVREAQGRGTRREYSPKNLMQAFVLKFLMDLGLPRMAIREFFQSARELYGDELFLPGALAGRTQKAILFYPALSDETGFRVVELGPGRSATDLTDRPGFILINVSWIAENLARPRLEETKNKDA